jgi:hypothetical protein
MIVKLPIILEADDHSKNYWRWKSQGNHHIMTLFLSKEKYPNREDLPESFEVAIDVVD